MAKFQKGNIRTGKIKQWRVGEYLRLSKDDLTAGTSVSIGHQKAIIHDFLEADPLQFTLVDTYIDDGISGATTEHRDEFKRLIEDVKSGLINCVITNDTSRFARNVADAEYYVNTVFPEYDVRFIALSSPRIDSYEDPESVDGMQFHFENYFNEYYVKMTSKKIRKVFDMKFKKGEFIGSYAPYGFFKDPDNKNKLIVDEEAAEIVRKIFDMFVYGKLSMRAVAMRLNDMGVLPPREYKETKGITPASRAAKIASWHYSTIRTILSDEKYCGHMVQGKLKNISYKVKKAKRQDPEDWVIVRNTHEPIISDELYQKAQVLLVRPSRAKNNGEKSLYSSFLYCERCNHVLSRGHNKASGRYYQRCGFHEMTRKCRPLYISEQQLSEQLLFAVKSQIVLVTEMDTVKQKILSSGKFTDDSKILQSNLRQLEKAREKLEAKSHRLYDDFDEGVIDKDLYVSRSTLLKQEIESVKDKIAKIQIEMRQFKKVQTTTDDYAERFKKYETVSEITRELLVDLVDKITVDKTVNPNGNRQQQPRHIKVSFKFADEHKALMQFITENAPQYGEGKLVAM
ncbi:MAG: recombinase family protein [Defluviitaleaceae bacterium]|nr:recombinase family protein [Defluviitaleaceae bacterium]